MFDDYGTNNANTERYPHESCPQLPGTILRINFPAGTTTSLLNLIELTSSGGICLILRIPLLGGNGNLDLAGLLNTINKQAEQYNSIRK
ncbi:hypothetical protein [Clostridium sp.]|uniref:hypothetical protein n=1 Tax=Clostridium sp. TaxID=1506 RepID=UPI002FCAB755